MPKIFDISIDEQAFGFLDIILFIFRSLSLFPSQILVCATGFCSLLSLFILRFTFESSFKQKKKNNKINEWEDI